MTATLIESAPSAQVVTPVLQVDYAEALFRAVSNALLFAAGKREEPLLQVVRVERDSDGTLRAMSTDRYRYFIQTVEHTYETDPGQFKFSLTLDDAKQVLNLLKTAGPILGAQLALEESRLKVRAGISEITVQAHAEFTFPEHQKVAMRDDAAADIGVIAFNPRFLADLGKLKFDRASAGGPAHFKFFGPARPVLIRFIGGVTILHMPVKTEEPQWRSAAEVV
jgi:DNA polymerase III sliding clamp (beta) subunit (PCNA family)